MTNPSRPRKHFIPLESNPDVFTSLVHRLGLSPSVQFHDVLSLDEPECLAWIPRPVLALVLVFPTSPDHEAELAAKDKDVPEYAACGEDEAVVWYKQTIHNACGLYGILHAVSNGPARDLIEFLEDDSQLEATYAEIALQGDTAAPASAEDEVDFHYVCFVKSHKDGHLYELDGDRKGPIDHGSLAVDDDLFSDAALATIRTFMEQNLRSIGFSLLALASTG